MVSEKKKKRVTKIKKLSVQERVTNHFIENLKNKKIPWRRPWNKLGNAQNFISKKDYSGINSFILGCTEYDAPFFVTYKQAKELGGNIIKGSKGFPVVFFSYFDKRKNEDGVLVPLDNDSSHKAGFLKTYTVFNIEQTEGIEYELPDIKEIENDPIEECQNVIDQYISKNKIELTLGGNGAYYIPAKDSINMPPLERFHTSEEYYSTFFHEMVHSTGHASRLNRDEMSILGKFGSHSYSKEELTAEMGAAFLCTEHKIDNITLDNSTAYINSWITKLKNDPKFIFQAAAKAKKAVELIKS